MLVGVLGPVEVWGAAKPITRAKALELVVYLAVNPSSSIDAERLMDVLWPEWELKHCPPGKKNPTGGTLNTTTSVARDCLGVGVEGMRLPHLQMPMPLISAVTMLDGLAEDPRTALLEGMVLFADDDGVLADSLVWLVQVPSIVDGTPGRGAVPGRRSAAGWRAVAEMMGAVVAWGDWTEPTSIPMPARPQRSDLRRLRQGSTRRLEEAGGLAGVRVLDARRRSPSRNGEASGTHASPIPHPRQGYWRNQPVGPRDEGRREPRWIPPTWVNAAGAQRGPLRVYRLPAAPKG